MAFHEFPTAQPERCGGSSADRLRVALFSAAVSSQSSSALETPCKSTRRRGTSRQHVSLGIPAACASAFTLLTQMLSLCSHVYVTIGFDRSTLTALRHPVLVCKLPESRADTAPCDLQGRDLREVRRRERRGRLEGVIRPPVPGTTPRTPPSDDILDAHPMIVLQIEAIL